MTSKLAGFGLRRPVLITGIVALVMLSGPSAKRDQRAGVIPPGMRSILALYGADAVTIDRNARDFRMPDQIEWKGRPGTPNQTATVFGDPSKPGMYVQLLKRGPNDWSRPHSHPQDRYLTVLKGTMLIGTGAKFDPKNTVALGPGSIIKDFANQVHYDGSGPDGLTLEIIGMGPSGMTPAEAK
jgi:quercetin dioxygenase-like cupin family protein